MKSSLLKLDLIVTTEGTQVRASLDDDTMRDYAEDMMDATNAFPPVVVFHDGSHYILADGFHRVMAAQRLAHHCQHLRTSLYLASHHRGLRAAGRGGRVRAKAHSSAKGGG